MLECPMVILTGLSRSNLSVWHLPLAHWTAVDTTPDASSVLQKTVHTIIIMFLQLHSHHTHSFLPGILAGKIPVTLL